MKRRLVILSALILSAPILSAIVFSGGLAGGWTHAADKDAASLSGRVVKEPGGEPIKKAVIELIEDAGGHTNNYTATSDAEGNFQIPDIRPGRYRILIERNGFVFVDAKHRSSDAAAISLERGQALTDQLFRMLPTAVVTGRVLDEDGDPMAQADVLVLRRTPSPVRHSEQVAGERTNDLGQYRISGIMPGRYLVSVTPPPDYANILTPGKIDGTKPDLAYVPTYYPNTTDRTQASAIDLRPGDEVPVDFSLVRAPTARIRGTVANLAEGAYAVVFLYSKDGSLVYREAEVAKDGKFELGDIAPGSYRLIATESVDDKISVARQIAEVRGTNLEGLRLLPLPGATLHGQVRVPGGGHVDFSRLVLTLHLTDEENEPPQYMSHLLHSHGAGWVKSDGSVEWQDLPPGSYRIETSIFGEGLAGFYVDSVNIGGRDVRDSSFTVSGSGLFLDVVLNPKGTKLEGTVLDDKDHPVSNAVVIAMPEEKFRKRSDRYAKATTDQHGQFSMQGLIPGQYSLLAWESLDGDSYLDADFRKADEERAVPVRLEPGQPAKVSLKALPAPDDQPQ